MRQYSIGYFFSLLLLLASCAGGEEVIVSPPEPDVNGGEVEEDAVVQFEVTVPPLVNAETTGTRSTAVITEHGAAFQWSDGDVIGIFSQYGDQVRFSLDGESGSSTASFNGGGWGLKNNYHYAAYYPFNSDNSNRYDGTALIDYRNQMQDGNGTLTYIGRADFMATSSTQAADGQLALKFRHLGCLVQMKLTLQEATEPLTQFMVKTVSDYIPVQQTLDLLGDNAPSLSTYETAMELPMSICNIAATDDNKVLTIYMMLPEMKLHTDGVMLSARISDGVDGYEGLLNIPGRDDGQLYNLEAGKIYYLEANLMNCSISGSSSMENFENINW